MKNSSVFTVAATTALFIAAVASAGTATGPGGVIPAGAPGASGGGGVFPTTLPPGPYMSSVTLSVGVSSVKSVTLTGLSHTWVGDLQAVLFNPAGVGTNIFYRPGSVGGSLGSSADFTGGTYVFVTAGAAPLLSTTANPPAGTYGQGFGDWPGGSAGVTNTPFSSFGGGAGAWSLVIYDWAGGDVGTLGSWTLDYNAVPAPGALALLGLAGLASRRRRA